MHLTAQLLSAPLPGSRARSILLTVAPARGVGGRYSYNTDTDALTRMLRQRTELRATTLEDFLENLRYAQQARLMSVEINDQTLTEIGYFVE